MRVLIYALAAMGMLVGPTHAEANLRDPIKNPLIYSDFYGRNDGWSVTLNPYACFLGRECRAPNHAEAFFSGRTFSDETYEFFSEVLPRLTACGVLDDLNSEVVRHILKFDVTHEERIDLMDMKSKNTYWDRYRYLRVSISAIVDPGFIDENDWENISMRRRKQIRNCDPI